MVDIAGQFKDEATKQKYLKACERFRYPYWDPCTPRQIYMDRDDRRNEYGIPLIVSRPSVHVRRPTNPEILEEIPNPLYQYTFPTVEQSIDNKDFLWERLAAGRGNVRQSQRISCD
jgi:hypothetical protein